MPRPQRNQFPNNKAYQNALRNYKGKGPAKNNNNTARKALMLVAQHPGIPYIPGLAMASKNFRAATPTQKRNEARRRTLFMKHKKAVNREKEIQRAIDVNWDKPNWTRTMKTRKRLLSILNQIHENILSTRRNIYRELYPSTVHINRLNYNPNILFHPNNRLGGRSVNNIYREVTGNGISRYRRPYPSFVPPY